MLFDVKLPPGLLMNGTEAQRAGRFIGANLMRWFQGRLGPINGWRKRFTNQVALTGVCRALLTWRENSGVRWIGLGTPSNLYAMSSGGEIFDITPAGYVAGAPDAAVATGYGRGIYGRGTYGSPRTDSGTTIPATTWSLDYWGEYLVGCSDSDGTIYSWLLDPTADAEAVTGAPTGVGSILVTPERFLVALKGRDVIWSDQEDYNTWTPSSVNQARTYTLPTAGNLQLGLKLQRGFLVLTTTDAWQATYLDPTYVYGFNRVGEGCGAISRKSAVSTDTQAMWMGRDGFYAFDGYVQPIACDIADEVFTNINSAQSSKVWTEHRSQYGEVWFHYPSASSTEIDKAAVYNYRENHWTLHDLARTAGTDKGVFNAPMFTDPSGFVYDAETGWNWGGAMPWAETAPFRLNGGDNLSEIQRIVPDETTLGDVEVTFKARTFPTSPETTYGPYAAANPTDVLFQAGQVKTRFDAKKTADFRIGDFKLDVRKGDPLL